MPIKICFFTTEYAIPELGRSGGIGVFIKNHARELAASGFDVFICTFSAKPKIFNDGLVKITVIKDLSHYLHRLKEGYRKSRIPGYITFKVFLSYLNRKYISIKFEAYLKENKIDIIELNDYGGYPTYFKTQLPVVIRCHGSATVLYKFFGYSKRAADVPFEEILFKRYANNVIGVSQYSADTSHDAFKLTLRPKVIYNGIDLPAVTSTVDNNYIAPPTIPFSVFYFGAIRERKGIDLAAKVFNQIIKLFPNATFHVSGSDNNKHWQNVEKEILSAQALSNTTYYGEIENSRINEHLKKAHLVLFPSYGENFSMALLEVMALGKIVVTSAIPSYKEIVNDGVNGFIADAEKDYVQIISANFKKEKNLAEISSQAKKTIKSRFSMDKVLKENIEYYKALINK
ncbi:Glycosyltransferase involved in cell wall bisynthesis [Flavobacteriaceae bacterium MAR_2010_188]|nr:Glycosyltransferase involved in cell wall bisynthesis [Flavobacteriaceae bacterium MAR_2010_188]